MSSTYVDDSWSENENGNFVMREGRDILATVFQNKFGVWQIVINADEDGHLVADEYFPSSAEAMERAGNIVCGASYECVNRPSSNTGWKKQAKSHNGKPTYGRKAGAVSVTVKCAVSGKWFYVPYRVGATGEAVGWFVTAAQAMDAFDARYSPPQKVSRPSIEELMGSMDFGD